MQRVLDSSPVNLQPAPVSPKRPLKRTASLASLPTPPRTRHKNKRSRRDFSDEEDKFESSESEHDVKPVARTLFKPKGIAANAKMDKVSEEAAEDAFWGGKVSKKEIPKEEKKQERSKVPSTIGSAPVSPPPSRRKQVGPRFKTPPPLPERALSPASSAGDPLPEPDSDDENGPIRDSPNNLFLVDSKKAYPPVIVRDAAEDLEEPPTVRYVFRGKGVEYPNPLYNLPPEVHERAQLPTEHPEYSPLPTVPPRRLFTKELASKDKKAVKRRRSPSPPSPTQVAVTRPKRRASPTKSSPGKPKKKRTSTPKAS